MQKKKQGWSAPADARRLPGSGFADAEHPGPAFYADTLGARFAVLHPDGLNVFHFSGGLAFHAISFHRFASWIFTFFIVANLKLAKGSAMRQSAVPSSRIIPGRHLKIGIGFAGFTQGTVGKPAVVVSCNVIWVY